VSVLHHSVQRRSGILLAGKTVVHVCVINLPTSTPTILLQLPRLDGGILSGIYCRDPCVDCGVDLRGDRAVLSYYSSSHFDLLSWSCGQGRRDASNTAASRLLRLLNPFLEISINRSTDQLRHWRTCFLGQNSQLLDLLCFEEQGCTLHTHSIPYRHTLYVGFFHRLDLHLHALTKQGH